MKKIRNWLPLFAVALTACAGFNRSCAAGCAQELGADWIVVQYAADGRPINCWKLRDVSVANEAQSDGVYWQSSAGHLVHISGWYNRVQVRSGGFKSAAKSLGVDPDRCGDGAYLDAPSKGTEKDNTNAE